MSDLDAFKARLKEKAAASASPSSSQNLLANEASTTTGGNAHPKPRAKAPPSRKDGSPIRVRYPFVLNECILIAILASKRLS